MAWNWKRLLQVRMRTLLIAVTLVACGLAFWTYFIARYLKQERALAELESFPIETLNEEAQPSWLAPVVGPERYHRVVQVRLDGREVDDAALGAVLDLPFLTRLYLSRTAVSDRGAQVISTLDRLERLSLWRTDITDDALPYLARNTNLEALDLHETFISDQGLAALKPLRKLRFLKLGGAIHGPGLESVAQLPELRELDISTAAVDFENLRYLAGSPIRELHFARQMPPRVIDDLLQLPNLREFHGEIVEADDKLIEKLAQLRRLESLRASGLGVTDAALKPILQLKRLKQLELHGDLTDVTLQQVALLPELEKVVLKGRFSQTAINRLARQRPRLEGAIHTVIGSDWLGPHTTVSPSLKLLGLIQPQTAPHMKVNSDSGMVRVRAGYVHARIEWPATLQDLVAQPDFHPYQMEVRLMWPPSFRPNRYYDEFSLDGIEQLTAISTLHAPVTKPEDLQRIGKLRTLRGLVLTDERLNDQQLQHLRLGSIVKTVHIVPSEVTPAAMTRLRNRYPNVTFYENGHGKVFSQQRWQSASVGQASLPHIVARERLVAVQLHGFRTPLNLDSLAQLSKLERLEMMPGSMLSYRQQLWRLNVDLPRVTSLNVGRLRVNDSQLSQLKHFPGLERLYLRYSDISDYGFEHFRHTPELKELYAYRDRQWGRRSQGPWLTGRTLGLLVEYCPQLKHARLSGNPIRGRFLEPLTEHPSLERLDLDDSFVDDEGCRFLSRIPKLKMLNLERSRVTDKGLLELAKHPGLTFINVRGTKCTDATKDLVRERRPDLKVR